MAIKTKRQKRRQATVTKAYKHVRKVMLALGLPVTSFNVPFYMPEYREAYEEESSYIYYSNMLSDCEGCYIRRIHAVMVSTSYCSVRYLKNLMHECCHANQMRDGWEATVEYLNRPCEMEARFVADIAVKLWCLPESEWGKVIMEYV